MFCLFSPSSEFLFSASLFHSGIVKLLIVCQSNLSDLVEIPGFIVNGCSEIIVRLL